MSFLSLSSGRLLAAMRSVGEKPATPASHEPTDTSPLASPGGVVERLPAGTGPAAGVLPPHPHPPAAGLPALPLLAATTVDAGGDGGAVESLLASASPAYSFSLRGPTVYLDRGTIRCLANVLFCLYDWPAVQGWRRDIVLHNRTHDGACWTREGFMRAMVGGLTWPGLPAHSVMHGHQKGAASIVASFWDECKRVEHEPCREHCIGTADSDLVVQTHPLFC